MLNILLAVAIGGLLLSGGRSALARRSRARRQLADRLSQGRTLARRLAGQRVGLERALSSLGDSQAEALYRALPQLRSALATIENFSLAPASDPRLPALCAHKRRRIAPAARALYGMAGVGAESLGWLTDGTPAARLLGVTLPAGAQALLSGEAEDCTDDDVRALRRLSVAIRQLRDRCGEAQKALQQSRRRLAEQDIALRIVLRQNRDYRSLSAYPLPGQLQSPRAIIAQAVQTAQVLTAWATTPLARDEPAAAPAARPEAAAPALLALAVAR